MLDGRTARWEDFRGSAQQAEEAEFDALWTVNHVLLRPGAAAATPHGFWDCWTLLSALAGVPSRLRLGTLRPYRTPDQAA